jgi:hypothetical protein
MSERRSADLRSDWQRRYDESLERERQRLSEYEDATEGEVLAMEAVGCLPGWLGAAGLAITAFVLFLRRRRRRR